MARRVPGRTGLTPSILPPPAAAKGAFEVHELRFLSRHKVHTDHIKTNRRRSLLRKLSHISARQAASALRAYASQRPPRPEPCRELCASSLQQSKASVPARQSDRCRPAHRLTTTAAPQLCSPSLQIKEGRIFAFDSSNEMSGKTFGVPTLQRHPIQPIEHSLQPPDTHSRSPFRNAPFSTCCAPKANSRECERYCATKAPSTSYHPLRIRHSGSRMDPATFRSN